MRSVSISLLMLSALAAQTPRPPRTPAQDVTGHFVGINRRVLEMAQDFPADKYNYRPVEGVRTFGEVIVHITSGNIYAAKAGRGEKVNWDELDPKDYKTKAAIVEALQKSIADATATLKAAPPESFAKSTEPWIDVIEHAGEHYGLLVAYYRTSGMIPPASRPKPKSN